MLYHSLPRGLPFMLICTLSACNAVSEDRMSTSGSNLSPDYERLASTANETSGLGGVALKLQPIPTATTLSSSSGTLDHATGATTINDGTYTLVDPDGFTADGLLTDGVSTLFSTPAQGFTGNYDYARVYTHAYFVNSVPFLSTGIYGVVTRSEDMPTAGSATLNGEAQASYFNSATNFDLSNGTSKVETNFTDGTVDVTTDQFEITNRDTGVSANVGFNGIKITGMKIFGNQFSGGTITTEQNWRDVEIITDRAQESALGRFFGLTNSGQPDEAGGIGYLRGDDGSLTTIFLAD
jgi:hypothetical protein